MGSKVVPVNEMVNQIGHKFEPSEWMVLDQKRIDSFADCTEDHQFIAACFLRSASSADSRSRWN